MRKAKGALDENQMKTNNIIGNGRTRRNVGHMEIPYLSRFFGIRVRIPHDGCHHSRAEPLFMKVEIRCYGQDCPRYVRWMLRVILRSTKSSPMTGNCF